jgi:hypothetical protein
MMRRVSKSKDTNAALIKSTKKDKEPGLALSPRNSSENMLEFGDEGLAYIG